MQFFEITVVLKHYQWNQNKAKTITKTQFSLKSSF